MGIFRNAIFSCVFLIGTGTLTAAPITVTEEERLPLTHVLLKNVSSSAEGFTIHDGTQWRVSSDYRDDVRTWLPGDHLVISLNHTPLSSYAYWAKNLRTNTYAAVNFFLTADLHARYTHCIRCLDQDKLLLFLNNRVGFEVDFRDKDKLKDWAENDTILLGISNTWFSSFNLMLININLNQHVNVKLHMGE